MKLIFLVTFMLTLSMSLLAQVEVHADVKYQYEIYHEPVPATYYEGRYTGRQIVTPEKPGYYETKWSTLYSMTIDVMSGAYANESLGYYKYEETKIICLVKWDNGGTSVVVVSNYRTDEKEMTVEGLGTGVTLEGYDQESRFWKIYL